MKAFFMNLFDAAASAIKWSFSTFRFTDALDIIVIAVLIFYLLSWIRRTKAWTLLKGIAVLAILWLVARILTLNMLVWIFERTLSVGILAVVIIFQPEIRRALERLGQGKLITRFFTTGTPTERFMKGEEVQELIDALRAMAKVKTGALICIEEKVSLDEYVQTGITVDGALTSQLLINIFEKNTPLHDGAVIIRNGRVEAATCYLPLSQDATISKELGTRHRAAIGLTELTDSKVFVVSEETGQVSMAYSGRIFRNISDEFIRRELLGDETVRKTSYMLSVEKLFRRKEKKDEAD